MRPVPFCRAVGGVDGLLTGFNKFGIMIHDSTIWSFRYNTRDMVICVWNTKIKAESVLAFCSETAETTTAIASGNQINGSFRQAYILSPP